MASEQFVETCRKPPSSDDEMSDADSENAKPEKRVEVIPDAVDHFLGQLLSALEKRDVAQINELYEQTLNKVTEKHYKNKRWPNPETISSQISDNPLFVILYKELYYRHVHSQNSQQFADRRGSWENYCKLFDLFILDLENGEDLSAALPAHWLWDILDEFVYHYQVFCTYRNKCVKMLTKQAEGDIKKLQDFPDVFDTPKVLTYLHELVEKSGIEAYLRSSAEEQAAGKANEGGAFKYEIVRRMGYFSIIQLQRLHSLLGDYQMAMETVQNVDFGAQLPMFYEIPACHISLFYYMGFSYMMMRRYVDAINVFCQILTFMQKTSRVNDLSYQFATMVKKQDSMYSLLLLCLTLSPRPVDEMIERTIREKYSDKQTRLQRELSEARSEYSQFEELFTYHCPKFVSAAAPDFEKFQGGEDFDHFEAHKRQVLLFLQEVRQQQALPTIGSYMKLYTAIQTSKLAQLCETDEAGLRDQLMCVMHKTRQPLRPDRYAKPLAGEIQSCSEVQFYLDGDTVHINANRPQKPHMDFFLENIEKFQELLAKVESSASKPSAIA